MWTIEKIRQKLEEVQAKRHRRWHRRLLQSLDPRVGPDLRRVNRPWDWNEIRQRQETDRGR